MFPLSAALQVGLQLGLEVELREVELGLWEVLVGLGAALQLLAAVALRVALSLMLHYLEVLGLFAALAALAVELQQVRVPLAVLGLAIWSQLDLWVGRRYCWQFRQPIHLQLCPCRTTVTTPDSHLEAGCCTT